MVAPGPHEVLSRCSRGPTCATCTNGREEAEACAIEPKLQGQEAVEHVDRLAGALGDHLEVGLPHVRAGQATRRIA